MDTSKIKRIFDNFFLHLDERAKEIDVNDIFFQVDTERYLINKIINERILEIKENEEEEKTNPKSEIEKREESKIIYQIAFDLFHKYNLITTCKQTDTIEDYYIEEGKRYEIIGVDFRLDGFYILMREYSFWTLPLFGGDGNKLYDCKTRSRNIYENIRRGFIDSGEPFLNDMKSFLRQLRCYDGNKNEIEIEIEKKDSMNIIEWLLSFFIPINEEQKYEKKTYKEFKKDQWKGVIEIPIHEFKTHFNDIEKQQMNVHFKQFKKELQFSERRATTHLISKGMTQITIKRSSQFPITLWVSEIDRSHQIIKKEFTEDDENERISFEFVTDNLNEYEFIIVAELPKEWENKSDLSIIIEGYNDVFIKFCEITHSDYNDHLCLIESYQKIEGNCELCGYELKEYDDIINVNEYFFHHCCYQFSKCIFCENKKWFEMYIYCPKAKAFVGSCCFDKIVSHYMEVKKSTRIEMEKEFLRSIGEEVEDVKDVLYC